MGVFKIFGPLRWTPPPTAPSPRPPLRRTALLRPKFRSFFSLSRRKFHSVFSLWGVFSLNFGFFLRAGRFKHHQNSTRERRKNEVSGGKKARNFGPPTLAPNPLDPNPSCPTFSGFGPPPLRAPTPSGRSWPTLAKTDFGQTESTCVCVFVCCVLCGVGVGFTVSWCGVSRVGVSFKVLVWSCSVPPRTALPRTALPRTALPMDRPSRGPPKISLFFPSPAAKFVLFFPLLGVVSLNFGGVFEGPGPSNVHVWALWLSCETPAAPPDRFRFVQKVGARRVGPRRVGPRIVGPRRVQAQTWKKWGPKGGSPKISLSFFFPLPPQFSFFFSLSWE